MQVAVVPLPAPAQLHVHGPLPLTVSAVPALQRFAVGATISVWPSDAPHAPLTAVTTSACLLAVQLAVVPPFAPAQLHVHGPLPLTDDAVPELHRLAAGAAVNAWPSDEPQAPFIAAAFAAEQLAVVPSFAPAQLHVHGPLPLTAEAVPVLQRFVEGITVNVWPLDEPHVPFTGVSVNVAVTVVLAVIENEQSPVPVHFPAGLVVQPIKVEPSPAAAANVMGAFRL